MNERNVNKRQCRAGLPSDIDQVQGNLPFQPEISVLTLGARRNLVPEDEERLASLALHVAHCPSA
jgi:hypothetical protein